MAEELYFFVSNEFLAGNSESVNTQFDDITRREINGWIHSKSDAGGVPVEMISPGRRVINRLI